MQGVNCQAFPQNPRSEENATTPPNVVGVNKHMNLIILLYNHFLMYIMIIIVQLIRVLW